MKIMIHHNADMDGWACAAIFKHKYPDGELIGWDYGYDKLDLFAQINELIDPVIAQAKDDNLELFMADVSLPYKEMAELANWFPGLFTWIDHHKSAWRELEPHILDVWQAPYCVVYDESLSGCELCWNYFFEGQDRDWETSNI